jgi:hypothetical protein
MIVLYARLPKGDIYARLLTRASTKKTLAASGQRLPTNPKLIK